MRKLVLYVTAILLMLFLGFGIYKIVRNINKAFYYSDTKKLSCAPKSENHISVVIQNRDWKRLKSENEYFLSYHIKDSSGNMLIWDGEMSPIDVPARSRGRVDLKVVAPENPGNYIISVDLTKRDNRWYSSYNNPMLEIRMTVDTDAGFADQKEMDRVKREIETQNEIDRNILSELHSGSYSLEDPLVILDPYGNSPLTALVAYTSEENESINIHIPGKTPLATIDFTFPEFKKEHIVPVYGLYADSENQIQLISRTENGNIKENTITISTEPLIEDLKNIKLKAYVGMPEKYEQGLNFSYTSIFLAGYRMGFDVNGDIRWYLNQARTSIAANYNRILNLYMCGVYSSNFVESYSPLGKLTGAWYIGENTHHDIEIGKNGNLLLTTEKKNGDTIEDKILEIDPENGKILTELDYKDILQRSRYVMLGYSNSDWMHMNSIVEDGCDLIISSNTQSTVVKNDRKGNIKWILSDPIGYLSPWSQYLLKPIGDDFEYPYNQHAVEVLPDYDNNPDTVDIMLFDNGSSRKYLQDLKAGKPTDGDEYSREQYSRLVHYRIDEKAMTVQQIWEYGKERPELYSRWRGDADLLKNGNVLGTFNRNNQDSSCQDSVYVEVDQDKNVVWECLGMSKLVGNNYSDYRCERLPIYSEAANDMKIGQEAKIIEVH